MPTDDIRTDGRVTWYWFHPRSDSLSRGWSRQPPGLLRRLLIGWALGWIVVVV
jgi:hypothetical protein